MSIEEKFKNIVGWSNVFGLKNYKYLNLDGIDCLQEFWEREGKLVSIWFTFCSSEVEELTNEKLIELVNNLDTINLEDDPEIGFAADDDGFTYLMFNLIADNSEHPEIKKKGAKEALEDMGPEADLFAPNPQTEGTISIDELLKPGKFYKESNDD